MSNSIYDKANATPEAWREVASKQMKGKNPDELIRDTAEGIPIRPLYTAQDTQDLEYADTMPGISPYVRGPQATMYAGRPWTIRQYAGTDIHNSPPKGNLNVHQNGSSNQFDVQGSQQ